MQRKGFQQQSASNDKKESDIVRVNLFPVTNNPPVEEAAKTKVSELDSQILREEDVGRLHIFDGQAIARRKHRENPRETKRQVVNITSSGVPSTCLVHPRKNPA